jgi:acetyl-CoA carboxylase biotin carboxylase subunit
MIAKCIFHGDTRQEALASAENFFKNVQIEGIKTNAPLFLNILANEDFRNGSYTTSFLTKKLVK